MPGSPPMRTASMTWSWCAGPLDSSAQVAVTGEAGGSATVGSGVPAVQADAGDGRAPRSNLTALRWRSGSPPAGRWPPRRTGLSAQSAPKEVSLKHPS